jgi:energy-converting hydrogenase B subunit D
VNVITIEVLSAALLLAAAIVIFTRDLLASVLVFAAFSLVLTSVFFLLDAPDVAIAEAGIGACLTTVVFVIAIVMAGRKEET